MVPISSPSSRLCFLLVGALAACHPTTTTTAPTPAPAPAHARASSDRASAHPDSASLAIDDVSVEVTRIFGEPPRLEESESEPAAEPSWDIDVRSYETHERVDFYVQRFSGGARDRFGAWLSRGTRYDAMIRAKLRAAGLPEDMTYLALIESGYDPHAYSRAAAVGMWQFMATTARGVGLRVDWWVDERRDPIRATEGAVKFIGWLNEQFGSLYLAAAAYNGGPGRISRGLSRFADDLEGTTGDDVFFALAEKDYLRAETKNYVPQLVAAALIAKAPTRYGITIEQQPIFEYDSVRVGPTTPVMAAGAAAGATLAQMRDLNSALIRGVTPPKDSFWIRLPIGHSDDFAAKYAALPESDRTAFARLTTTQGETLNALARRSGVTVKQLGWFNRDLKPNRRGVLPAGLTVLVPSPVVLAAALDVPDPSIEIYGSSTRGRTTTHVVRRGESLGLIAKRYGTTVAEIKRLNRLKKTVIYPGQVIVVRGSAAPSTRAASVAAKPRTTTASASVHVVAPGETLTSIARRYGTTVAAIKAANGLKSDGIRVGQRLRVTG